MTAWLAVLTVLAAATATWRAVRRTRYFLHIFQLETYKSGRYLRWLRSHLRAVLRPSHGVGAAVLVGAWAAFSAAPRVAIGGALVAWTGAFISSRRYRSTQEKKPLAFTARMTRLAAATGALALLPVAAGVAYAASTGAVPGLLAVLAGFLAADLGAPLWVLLGALGMRPVDTAIQEGFKRDARARLRNRPDLTVIGITGSYGKTSTKFILAELLRQKYNVLATPSSYNTPMGLCLVVNEKLKPEHQVLVLEYGIRYPGDMAELCDIVQPDLSVVTTVGVAHLDTMGSVEAIAEEKGGLVEATAEDGPVVLNADNAHVRRMASRASEPIWRVSVDGAEGADVTARDVQYDTRGTSFVVTDDTGTEVRFQTTLLGTHNVANVLLAVAAGRAMGLRLRQMAHAVRRVEPIEHRLALRTEGDVTVIDDAFNSNPVGARNAIEILSQMNGGRRVIVTPGMVELGERQYEENRALGAYIAAHDIDLAVLVGEAQTAPIQDGLREAQFPADRMKVVPSLQDAQSFLRSFLQPGDVVLYENDLPDQYDN